MIVISLDEPWSWLIKINQEYPWSWLVQMNHDPNWSRSTFFENNYLNIYNVKPNGDYKKGVLWALRTVLILLWHIWSATNWNYFAKTERMNKSYFKAKLKSTLIIGGKTNWNVFHQCQKKQMQSMWIQL